MITCVSGKPGSGKSYYMTSLIMCSLSEGRTVYCNFPVLGAHVLEFDDMKMVGFPDGSVLYIDEANSWFRNREWQDFPKEVFQLFMHHRHFNMDMVLIAQNPETLDKNIRDIIQEYVWCGSRGFYWYNRKGVRYKYAIAFKWEYYNDLKALMVGNEEMLIAKSWQLRKRQVFKNFDSYYKFMEMNRIEQKPVRWEDKLGMERIPIEVPKYRNMRHRLSTYIYRMSDILKKKNIEKVDEENEDID